MRYFFLLQLRFGSETFARTLCYLSWQLPLQYLRHPITKLHQAIILISVFIRLRTVFLVLRWCLRPSSDIVATYAARLQIIIFKVFFRCFWRSLHHSYGFNLSRKFILECTFFILLPLLLYLFFMHFAPVWTPYIYTDTSTQYHVQLVIRRITLLHN